ncbi:MAG: hypothetical protein EZS26_003382 [Candidatus Ordinivivax streblomastigis]|uniref:Uncharacterized protein n=1 Tax=Candidatus Ordinivivax streblomastigis TaxID=2540710 RepID=A0A5M8NTT6_9BACT|nr:MAG: hypothetical protein EZS26_003382 [Candidatus Ordinivivax streblomastigis]
MMSCGFFRSTFYVIGTNMDELLSESSRIVDELRKIPGISDPVISVEAGNPEISITLNYRSILCTWFGGETVRYADNDWDNYPDDNVVHDSRDAPYRYCPRRRSGMEKRAGLGVDWRACQFNVPFADCNSVGLLCVLQNTGEIGIE